MKVKVINRFIDKETRKLHKENELMELTKKRVTEIQKAGNFVEEVKEIEKINEKE
ncbi:hypothetical protein [Anaerosacchariphilus polymeriproducens]|uniref:hypothetical protein n=1 Tax=Anaerosacchariphilus polymeriproducens TaxID=1812858 RepID=UPI0012D70ACF|nr:hypothetical protein [Anaerosacchariphilus polymeriproducens]